MEFLRSVALNVVSIERTPDGEKAQAIIGSVESGIVIEAACRIVAAA
jgi:hypothetical protein